MVCIATTWVSIVSRSKGSSTVGTVGTGGQLKMLKLVCLCLIFISWSAPQYIETQTGDLDAGSLDKIK